VFRGHHTDLRGVRGSGDIKLGAPRTLFFARNCHAGPAGPLGLSEFARVDDQALLVNGRDLTNKAAKLLRPFFVGEVARSSDRQAIFGIPQVVEVLGETERFAEDARFEPARVPPCCCVTAGPVSNDVEFEAIVSGIYSQYSGIPARQYRSRSTSSSFSAELALTTSSTISGVPLSSR
jgi:hypothetical protein